MTLLTILQKGKAAERSYVRIATTFVIAMFGFGLVFWPTFAWWTSRYKTVSLIAAPATTITFGTPSKASKTAFKKVIVQTTAAATIRVVRGNYRISYKNPYTKVVKDLVINNPTTINTPVLNSTISARKKGVSPGQGSIDAVLPSLVSMPDGYTITQEKFLGDGKWYVAFFSPPRGNEGDGLKALLYYRNGAWQLIDTGQTFPPDQYSWAPADVIAAANSFATNN